MRLFQTVCLKKPQGRPNLKSQANLIYIYWTLQPVLSQLTSKCFVVIYTNTNIYTEADVKGLLRIDRAELGKIISTTTDDDKDDKNSDKDNDNKDNDKDKDNDNDNDTEKTSESESGEGDDSDGK